MLDTKVIIIGAGQAGCSVAAKLRALGHTGPIVMIGEEPHPPYQRPPLRNIAPRMRHPRRFAVVVEVFHIGIA